MIDKIKIYWPLLVAILICLVAPSILASDSSCNFFDFSDTGEIGDTIGGITAPIIGIVSIYFLIENLRSQKEAIDKQKEANQQTEKQVKEEKISRENEFREQRQMYLLETLLKSIEQYKKTFDELKIKQNARLNHYGFDRDSSISILYELADKYSTTVNQVNELPHYYNTTYPFVALLKRIFEHFKLASEVCVDSDNKLKLILVELEYFILTIIGVPQQAISWFIRDSEYVTQENYVGKELLFTLVNFHKLEKDINDILGLIDNKSRFGESYINYYKTLDNLENSFKKDGYYQNKIFSLKRN